MAVYTTVEVFGIFVHSFRPMFECRDHGTAPECFGANWAYVLYQSEM